MKLAGKTVCVTGGAGFIGSALCRELILRGAKVIAFDTGTRANLRQIENDLEIVTADVRDLDSLREPIRKSQVVFHLAAIERRTACQRDFALALDVNVQGTANVLSLCSHVERLVFMSSTMVYGEPKYLPVDESHPLDGYEPYAVTKIAGESLCKAYHFLNGLPFAIVRGANTFGPQQGFDCLIPTMILQGLKRTIEVWTPDVVRDFLYVDDCVDALIKVAETEAAVSKHFTFRWDAHSTPLNLGQGHGTTIGELAGIISKYLHTTWVDVKKPPPVTSKIVGNIARISYLTGWKPKVSLEEGLRRTIEYYKAGGKG
ncbi:MAG: SDR family NAD(P)-dependent oxidoreductase [Dehalococcoidales bacterium]|nr:SDR family NAD(P)-dependent oxidoreductase [Dehalococcoidales bacterium]